MTNDIEDQYKEFEGVPDMLDDNEKKISIKKLLQNAYNSEKAWEEAVEDYKLHKEAKAQGIQVNNQDVTSEMVRHARTSQRIKVNKWNDDTEILGKTLRTIMKKYGKKKFKKYETVKILISEIVRMKSVLKKQISE